MILYHQVLLHYVESFHVVEIQKYLNDEKIVDTYPVSLPYTAEDASLYVEQEIQGRTAGRRYAFAIEVHEAFLGICALYNVDQENKSAELYYWTAVPFWGKGIATLAVRHLVNYAEVELGVTSLMTGVLKRNYASQRVLEKNGFCIVHSLTNQGEYHERFLGETIVEMTNNPGIIAGQTTLDLLGQERE